MIKWNKHRINGSYAHGLSFGGYRVRQIPTRICVSRERFGTNIIAGKPSSTVFCCLKVSFTIKWKKKEKLSNRLTAAILKDLRLEIEQFCKYQLIFVTAEGVLSEPFLFWLKKIKKKRKLPYRSTPLRVIGTVISINVRSLLFSVIDSCQQETKSQQKQKTDGPVQTSRRDS